MPPDPAQRRPAAQAPFAPTATPKLLRRPEQTQPSPASTNRTPSPPLSPMQPASTSPAFSPDPDPIRHWRETPPPPPPRRQPVDPLDDFIVPPTPESKQASPTYAEIARRPPPIEPPHRRHLRSARPMTPPRRQLKSAFNIPSWSSYFNAHAPARFNARPDGTPRRAAPRPSSQAHAQPDEPGWTRVRERQWRRKVDPQDSAVAPNPPRDPPISRPRPASPRRNSPAALKGRQHSLRSPTASTKPGFKSASEARAVFHLKTQGRCFKCLARDHRASACRDPIRCLHCFRTGHKQRLCPHIRRQQPLRDNKPGARRAPHSQANHRQQASVGPTRQQTPTKMAVFHVGDPVLRPEEDSIHVPTSYAMECELRDWEDNALVTWAMNVPLSTTARNLEDAIIEDFRLRQGGVNVTRHRPETFLIRF
ncbi:unnamed protein product [Urochloa humidicola]